MEQSLPSSEIVQYADVDAFVEKTLELVKLERDEEVLQTQILRVLDNNFLINSNVISQEGLSEQELEKRGLCIRKLRIVGTSTGLGGRTLLKLESNRGGTTGSPLPANKFSAGNM